MNLYDKFLVADCFDVVSVRNGKVIAVDEDNTSVSVSLKTSIKEIKAGQGNKLFCTLRSKDSIEVVTETPKLNLFNLAETLGQNIVIGSGEAITKAIKIRIDSTLTKTLDETPKDSSNLEIYVDGELLTKETDYTYLDGTITFKGLKAAEGKVAIVSPYTYTSNAKTSKIKIDAISFPGGVELRLTTFAINKSDSKEGLLQFRFYNAVADGSLDFATKSERDAVSNKITYKILSSEDDTYGEILFIPNED